MGVGIHPQAYVEDSAIGDGSVVRQFASISRRAVLGENCRVAPFAVIDGAALGRGVIVSAHAFICPGVKIDDDVFIGPHAVFCNDMWPRVSKDGFEIFGVVCRVRTGASIGANATILPGITIGRNAMVAAGAVAEASVPDNHLLDRSGDVRPIRPEWRERRMRFV